MMINKAIHRPFNDLFQRQFMLPTEHGAWVFLFSPLLIGLVLGGRFSLASGLLVIAALAAFLLRQPVTMIVKIYSGRRPRKDLYGARFWMAVYGVLAAISVGGLLWLGYSFILLLALPAIPVLGWHLWLVSRRAERRQMVVELAGSAALALAAPAAYWVGKGAYDSAGWLLWVLCWLQIAGSIVYAYLRLAQRKLAEIPNAKEQFRMGVPAMVLNTLPLVFAVLLAWFRVIPMWLSAAYAVQWLEVLWGITHPAVRARPAVIGMRQLIVSSLFTIIFVVAWL